MLWENNLQCAGIGVKFCTGVLSIVKFFVGILMIYLNAHTYVISHVVNSHPLVFSFIIRNKV